MLLSIVAYMFFFSSRRLHVLFTTSKSVKIKEEDKKKKHAIL